MLGSGPLSDLPLSTSGSAIGPIFKRSVFKDTVFNVDAAAVTGNPWHYYAQMRRM